MRREPVYDAYFDEYGNPQMGRTYDRIWYTVREAAEQTGVSVRTMRQYIVDKKVRAVKKDGVWWIEKRLLEKFKKQREMSRKGIDRTKR